MTVAVRVRNCLSCGPCSCSGHRHLGFSVFHVVVKREYLDFRFTCVYSANALLVECGVQLDFTRGVIM